jgi:ribosomal 30S subunit maturation factor RimM
VLVVSSEETSGDSQSGDSNKEHLIPWVMDSAIIAVDLEQGIIEVDWDADF